MTKNKSKSDWSVRFGAMKSTDVASGAIFVAKPKQSAYNRSASWRSLKSKPIKGTNSECY